MKSRTLGGVAAAIGLAVASAVNVASAQSLPPLEMKDRY